MLRQNNYFIVIEKCKVYHFDYYPDFFCASSLEANKSPWGFLVLSLPLGPAPCPDTESWI